MFRHLTVIALLFVTISGRSQQIKFVDFVCNGCNNLRHKKSQADLQKLIEKETSLLSACNKISGYFSPGLGDHFILAQTGPDGQMETMCYPFTSSFPPSRKSKLGFYFAFKGDVQIYQFEDLRNLFRDSLAVFDTLRLDFTNMAYRDDEVLQSFSIKYSVGAKNYEKMLPFDTLSKSIVLTYQDIFGAAWSRKTTDALKVSVHYKESGKYFMLSPRIRLFFLTAQEEKDLKKLLS
ncbi:MAG TPA: hypothetical protein VGO58_01540, partial [Chitinophagaceae bacterium]|nr:hypothetical protein [Chitinophagaceae bacterium]